MTHAARVRVTNPTGLHARPAVKLAQLAAGYSADVEVRVDDGAWVRARSTAKVMKLKARADATLQFRATGEEAAEAVAALVDFVRRDFDEGPDADASPPVPAKPAPATRAPAPKADRIARGTVASRGIAVGRLHVVATHEPRARRIAGDADAERDAFRAAVGTAATALAAIAARSDAAGAGIVAFQTSLLRDTDLIEPVEAAIARGEPADTAWAGRMTSEIEHYEGSGDVTLRERAADLRDLRDRVAGELAGEDATPVQLPEAAIVVADELTPSQLLALPAGRLAGIASRLGGIGSHVSLLARSRGLPCLVELDLDPGTLEPGSEAVLDAERGCLLVAPTATTRDRYAEAVESQRARSQAEQRHLAEPARTADGIEVRVCLNVDDPALLAEVDSAHCDGIGLTRTEFLFEERSTLPDEAAQLAVYRRLVEWAGGRPVTVRTLDAGGDKPIPGFTLDGERNPFLGVRGLRLSLARPEVFAVQLRALARAAACGPLRVMLPMVTLGSELAKAREMLDAALESLAKDGIPAARPPLGIMVEVPAAALTIEGFDADFYSIGSNDLVQYVMAAGRDSSNAAALRDPRHPAVLALIERVARHGADTGAEVSVCGEMAAEPECVPDLLAAGVRTLSVPPARLAATKAAVAHLDARLWQHESTPRRRPS